MDSFQLLDLASGEVRGAVVDHNFQTVVFSPDSRLLASVSGDQIFVGLPTGRMLRRFKTNSDITAISLSRDGKTLAAVDKSRTIRLWELATGQERFRLPGYREKVQRVANAPERKAQVAFAPDGKTLALAGADQSVHLWDLRPSADKHAELSLAELERQWTALTDANAAVAYRAMHQLIAAPRESVKFLRHRMQTPPVDPRLADLAAKLDHANYPVRQRATEDLKTEGTLAKTALRQAMAKPASPEQRRRLQQLLDRLDFFPATASERQAWRAVEVVEAIGGLEARELLRHLAQEPPGSLLAELAQEALVRLGGKEAN